MADQDFLTRLRSKPKMLRDQLAFGGAVGLTAVIALVWLVSLPDRFAQVAATAPVEEVEESRGAFQNLFEGIRSQVASVQDSLSELEEESIATESTGSTTTSQAVEIAGSATGVIMPVLSATTTFAPTPRTVLIGTSTATTVTDE